MLSPQICESWLRNLVVRPGLRGLVIIALASHRTRSVCESGRTLSVPDENSPIALT